jgi:hypothetical protein
MYAHNRSRIEATRQAVRVWVLGGFIAAGLAAPACASAPLVTPLSPMPGSLRAPARMAADAQGNLYVTDSRAGSVSKLSSNGVLLVTRTGLSKPLGVAVGNQNRVYVGEEGTGRVLVFDTTLTNTPSWLGAGTNEFSLPNHIAVDTTQSNGWIYVSDSRTNQIRCYTNTTLVKTFGAKGSGDGQFDFPAGVYASPSREVYVVDQNNDRVQAFNSTGAFQRAFSLRTPADLVTTNVYGRAQGITGDGAGSLFVADAFQDEVKVFDTQGAYQTTVGGFGEWIGQFRTPASPVIGTGSRLFVTSANNGRIEIFSVQGAVVTLVTLQVVSAYGTPAPAAGIYTNVAGAALTNQVDAADTRGTTRYVCTGWSMTGNDPQSGITNAMTMTHTNAAVLTWLWKTQYDLTVSAATNGAVAATNGWWDAGTIATASATPVQFYHFSEWTGTLSSVISPLFITMDQPCHLTALFMENLATNGVPQWWLASYRLTNGGDWDAAALGNGDTDALLNWQEWVTDTDPTNSLSYLGMDGIAASATGTVLRWRGGVLATQVLERTGQLAAPWQAIFTNLPPTAVTTNQFDPAGTNAPLFYRIRATR